MRSIRRVGVLAAAGILLTAAAGGQAAAQTAASYTGSASGYALRLSGLGQTFTAGGSEAQASSTGSSTATGTGDTLVSENVVTATNPPGETKERTCAQTLPPAPLNVALTLGLACGTASATGSGLTTAATAKGEVVGADVNVQNVINQLPLPVSDVTGTIGGALDEFCAALPAPLAPLCTVTQTVDEVLVSATGTQTLAAEIGSSTSSVTVQDQSVTSESTGTAAIIKVLPFPELDGVALSEPFATITVSRAQARVVCDLGTGNASPTFDPAIVRVKLAAPINALLDQAGIENPFPVVTIPNNPLVNGELAAELDFQNGEFSVTPGTTVVLFPGLPIETEIAVGSGTAQVNPDRSATAAADGVKIHAVRNLPDPLAGGLLLNLAHAEAAGACVAATQASAAPPVVEIETPRELPRTGGTPWLPVAGVAGLAAALVTRRALRSN